MSYFTTLSDCSVSIPAYNCESCPNYEEGRIDVLMLVRKGTPIADPTNPAEWLSAFTNDNLRLLNNLRAGQPKAQKVEAPGFGRQAARITGYNRTLEGQANKNENNWLFFNNLNKNPKDWELWYGTKDYIYRVKNTPTWDTDRVIEPELSTTNVFAFSVSWSELNMPESFPRIPNFFELCDLGA